MSTTPPLNAGSGSRTAAGPSPAPRADRVRRRLAMALYGDLTFDSRVQKEARSLAEAGYDVTIVCLASAAALTDLPPNVTVLVRRQTGAGIIPGAPNPFFSAGAGRFAALLGRVRWLVAYGRGLRSWGRMAVEAAGPVDAWHAHDLTGLAAIVPSLRRRRGPSAMHTAT